MEQAKTAAEARLRGKLYEVLAVAFYPPTVEAKRIWDDLTCLSEGLRTGEKTNDDEATVKLVDFSTLEQEYNRLFVGPGHVLCPPYE